jgi:hypothetical protein
VIRLPTYDQLLWLQILVLSTVFAIQFMQYFTLICGQTMLFMVKNDHYRYHSKTSKNYRHGGGGEECGGCPHLLKYKTRVT